MRVVSLVPSLTETVLAWGITPIACTRFCEQPTLVHVGGTKDPDIAAIVALQPDLVLVNDEENRRDDVETLVAAGVEVLITHVAALSDVAPMLDALAQSLHVQSVHSVVQESARWSAAISGEVCPERSFVLPIWRRPWMLAGPDTYGSSVLEHLGWRNACPTHRYPELTAPSIRALNADVVIAPSEPYPFTKRQHAELATLIVPTGRVVYVDGQDLLWWGVRSEHAVGRLAEQLST
jgi:ABC-type hemin transport system substrate-binding protein